MPIASKLRVTVAVIAAASVVASATGPMTSTASAQKNIPGRFQRSSEGLKHRLGSESCGNDHDRYNQLVDAGEDFLLNNQTAAANAAFDAAAHILKVDKNGGCAWAQRLAPSHRPGPDRPNSAGTQAA